MAGCASLDALHRSFRAHSAHTTAVTVVLFVVAAYPPCIAADPSFAGDAAHRDTSTAVTAVPNAVITTILMRRRRWL